MGKRELKKLFGCKIWQHASNMAYARLEKRKWRTADGQEWTLSGMDTRKAGNIQIHFTWIKSIEPGVVQYRRVAMPLETALDCVSGQFTRGDYKILC